MLLIPFLLTLVVIHPSFVKTRIPLQTFAFEIHLDYFKLLILISTTSKSINMRFTSIFVAGAFATMAAAQSKTASVSPAQQSQLDCLDACDAGDVKCQSYCISVSPILHHVDKHGSNHDLLGPLSR